MGIAALLTALVLHAQAAQPRPVVSHPVWPATGTITSPFGRDGSRQHPGLDIGILRSLSVRAATSGRVVMVGRPRGYEGYGDLVVVREGRYRVLYAHLSAWRVMVGQRVRAGQRIGTAGCTGWCTGTHLHFEVRLGDNAVSPLTSVLRPLLHPRVVVPVHELTAAAPPLAHKPLL